MSIKSREKQRQREGNQPDTMAANTGVQSLCRQVGRLTRGAVDVFYIILGTFNYDNGIFTLNPAADAKDIRQVSVQLTHNGNSFNLAAGQVVS